MSVTPTSSTKTTVYNPKYLYITVGSTTYNVSDVVRDSVSISQDDAEENAVESEFSSSPIINNIVPGSYNFAASVGDMQGTLLAALMGFTYDSSNKKAYAPSGYTEVFAEVALVFECGGSGSTTNYVAVILPHVQLNASITIESLNSSVGTIAIAGIAQETTVDSTHTTALYIDYEYELPTNA